MQSITLILSTTKKAEKINIKVVSPVLQLESERVLVIFRGSLSIDKLILCDHYNILL